MLPLVILVVVAASAVLCAAFFHLDRLIRAEHDCHHEAWVADGRPFFIGAPERLGLGSHLAWMRVSWVWPLRTPSWVRSSAEHARRLRLLRTFVLAWNLPFIVLAVCIVYALSVAH